MFTCGGHVVPYHVEPVMPVVKNDCNGIAGPGARDDRL